MKLIITIYILIFLLQPNIVYCKLLSNPNEEINKDSNNNINNNPILSIPYNLDINASEDLKYKYKYRKNMEALYCKANDAVAEIIMHYMDKASYIPIKTPYWLIAIMSIEYNYKENEKDFIFSFPVDAKAIKNNQNYFWNYNWKEVQRLGGNSLVTRRTGGAIGMLQLESFFAENVSPLIVEDFGKIGADVIRQDCYIELGENVGNGTSIYWKHGSYADRWSLADAVNITLAVYNETLKRVNGKSELNNLNNDYSKATMLMWAHNRGTGLLGQADKRQCVENIMLHFNTIKNLIYKYQPNRFSRQSYLMPIIEEIAEKSECDTYPVMCLASYIITEARYNGQW